MCVPKVVLLSASLSSSKAANSKLGKGDPTPTHQQPFKGPTQLPRRASASYVPLLLFSASCKFFLSISLSVSLFLFLCLCLPVSVSLAQELQEYVSPHF